MKIMNLRACPLNAAAVFSAFALASQVFAQIITTADSFGTGANTFTIDFVSIGNAGNDSDAVLVAENPGTITRGYGAVPYQYRIGRYEISQNNIDQATASGLVNVTAGADAGNRPAGNISWYEAAAFVNWMNTSTGKQAAYDLTFSGGSWSMNLWSSAQAWTAGGTNRFRHKDAFYFLPSEDEWYKAAYFNPAGANYFLYPTGSDAIPTSVAGGTNASTAVYGAAAEGPAEVTSTGGLSPYGTMGQGGNMWEWNESSADGVNGGTTLNRTIRGGGIGIEQALRSSFRTWDAPQFGDPTRGFRVASVPEPSTYALLLMTGAGALWLARRRR